MVVARAGGAREEAPRLSFDNDFHLPSSPEDDVRSWIDVFTRRALDEAAERIRVQPGQRIMMPG